MDEIVLGGNIVLQGFRAVKSGEVVIIKKIVGQFVKEISSKGNFQKFVLELKSFPPFCLKATAQLDKEIAAEDKDNNLFFALNKVLKTVGQQIQ